MISLASSAPRGDAATIAANLRRLMARHSLTYVDVVEASGLDERTVRGIARARSQPHARTLHKLAEGLSVEIDELFRPLGRSGPRAFDRATNQLVESVVSAHPERFTNWSEADFDELYSRFGTGGQLTESGVLAAADAIRTKRDLWHQISIILESGDAELLAEFVGVLYERAVKKGDRPN